MLRTARKSYIVIIPGKTGNYPNFSLLNYISVINIIQLGGETLLKFKVGRITIKFGNRWYRGQLPRS